MNILVCDDMMNEARKLAELLEQSDFHVNTALANNGAEALEYTRSGRIFDCGFLDVVMPEMDGIQLAHTMREEGFKGEIVFLTTSKDYAIDAFGVRAFDYMLKPATAENVGRILQKLEDAGKDTDTDGIMITTRSITRYLLFRDIAYVEVINHKVYYKLTDGSNVEVRTSFAEIVPLLLRDNRFAQCHNSFIVNMNAITEVTVKEIVMRNKARIPISKNFSNIKNKYLLWITRGG